VIGITPKKGTSARVLEETGNFVCDISDKNEITAVVGEIIKGNIKTEPNIREINKYHYQNVASDFLSEIEGIK
jgi:hypothetical protein